MKFESHWPKGSGGVCVLKQIIHDFLFLALAAILFIGAEPFWLFWYEVTKATFL